ncbi:MAG TPA: hypothetical protein VG797_09850, partial [Phycisphaerales bacterium]|nr:hypothetical protein [Phycisphaerales bacterium]
MSNAPTSSTALLAGPKRSGPPSSSGGAPAQQPPVLTIDPMRLLKAHYLLLTSALIAGLVLGTGLYFVLRQFMPRYSAVAQFMVSPPIASASERSEEMGAGSQGGGEMEKYMQTQLVVLRSEDLLRKVAEDNQVKETAWARQADFKTESGDYNPDEALRELKKIVGAKVIPETQIIQVSLSTFSRDSSKTIVDTLSKIFVDTTKSRTNLNTSKLIDSYSERVRNFDKAIQAIEVEMDSILQSTGMTGLNVQESSFYGQIQTIQPAITDLNEKIAQADQQLKTYETLANAPGGPVVPEAIRSEVERSPIIQEQDARIAQLQASIRSTQKLTGENHRDLRYMEKQLDSLKQERDATLQRKSAELFKSVIESMTNGIDSQKASVKELETKLGLAKEQLQAVTLTLKKHEARRSERESLKEQRDELSRQLTELNLLFQREGRIRILGGTVSPNQLAFPQPIQVIPAFTLLILGATGGLLVLREMREQRIRGPQDVAMTRTAVLGMVPDLTLDLSNPERAELACIERPTGAMAESVRHIRGKVVAWLHGNTKSLLICSGLPESGGSSIIGNLAVSIAATDMRVLVIDANVRRPTLHRIFGLPEGGKGLSDVLLNGAKFDEVIRESKVPGVFVVPAGNKDHRLHERFMMPVMGKLLEEAKTKFDIVLIDAAPAVVGSDAIAIARHCDGVALVVRALKETRGVL